METLETYLKYLGSTKDIKYLTWDQTKLLHASVTQKNKKDRESFPTCQWWSQDT